jgi:transposase-like protein
MRKCLCCSHRESAAIDLALARGVAVSALARRYDISTDAIYRHRKAHLSPQLRAKLVAGPDIEIDLDKLRDSESQSLLANLVAIRHRLFASLDIAEEYGDSNMICRVTGQLHQNLELTGKLLGDLGIGHSVTNNVLVMPAYVELRMELINALRPFPEAGRAVADALHQIEHKAAEAIKAEAEQPLFKKAVSS